MATQSGRSKKTAAVSKDNGKFLRKSGAVEKRMPSWIDPQLALLVDSAPAGNDWIHETKFDGYRILAFVNNGSVRLMSRNKIDWTAKFPALCKALKNFSASGRCFIMDGELCVNDSEGKSSFGLLQRSFKNDEPTTYDYFAFDLLYLDGYDCRAMRLESRKEQLRLLIKSSKLPNVSYSEHVKGSGPQVLEHAREFGWEGIISKCLDSPYSSRRGAGWLKIKCLHQEEFAVLGFTKLKNNLPGIGALLLGYPKDGQFIFCGKVGTGFTQHDREEIYNRLRPRSKKLKQNSNKPLLNAAQRMQTRGGEWIKPSLVVQIAFTEWTHDSNLRHPVFLGIREDKVPAEVATTPPDTV